MRLGGSPKAAKRPFFLERGESRRCLGTGNGLTPYSCLAPSRPHYSRRSIEHSNRAPDDRSVNHPGVAAEDFRSV